MIDWHRLFGLVVSDLFAGSPFVVEIEKELSKHQRFLDLLVVRRLAGDFAGRLPDGFDDLKDHNLITYKSLRQALDDWALKEHTGHYVNYRKEVSPKGKRLLSEERFRLYAICTRFPQKLSKLLQFEKITSGVYDTHRGSDRFRIIVLSQVSPEQHNAIWQLFSGEVEAVRRGAERFPFRAAQPCHRATADALFSRGYPHALHAGRFRQRLH
jgi:hypothetical protein